MMSVTRRRPHDLIWLSNLPAREALLALREGRLTGWNDAGPLSPRFWIDKLECDVAMGVWKVSRAEALCVHGIANAKPLPPQSAPPLPQLEPEIMPDEQAKKYILLWDLAHEEARQSGHPVEWHWLRYIDAFLRGELAPSGIVHFYANHDAADRRACLRYSPDDFRAKIEMEAGRADLTIETLLDWRWGDYTKNLSEFRRKPGKEWRLKGYFIRCDPSGKLGLFVQRDDFAAWRARASAQVGEQPATTAVAVSPWEADLPERVPLPTNRRGPRSKKQDEAVAKMHQLLRDGTMAINKLAALKQKELESEFPNAKRTTLVAARKMVLEKLQQNSGKRQIAARDFLAYLHDRHAQ